MQLLLRLKEYLERGPRPMLPSDVWLAIMGKLPTDSVVSLARTSRRLRAIVKSRRKVEVTKDYEMRMYKRLSVATMEYHCPEIAIVGPIGAGKSVYIESLRHGLYLPHQLATIGIDFHKVHVTFDNQEVMPLMLWEMKSCSSRGLSSCYRVYLRRCAAVLFVCDWSDRLRESLECIQRFKLFCESEVGDELVYGLVVNKADQPTNQPDDTDQLLAETCSIIGARFTFFVSSKEQFGLIEPVQDVLERCASKVFK